MNSAALPRVIFVPGLRGQVAEHWQTRMAAQLPGSVTLAPLGRDNLDLQARVQQLEEAVQAQGAPVVLVAHSGGCVTVAHWAARSAHTGAVAAALQAAPPTFDRELPPEYPALGALQQAGWTPVPRQALPFRTLVAASRDDALGPFDAVAALAADWGAALVDLGAVGHLNPASGFGEWPHGFVLLAGLLTRRP